MSAFLASLAGLSTAEQFFATLDVPFDQTVMNVHRLHLLKTFRDRLDFKALEAMDDAQARTACRAALEEVYQDFAAGKVSRTFKVFKQADPAFVPLSDLLGGR